MNGSKGPHIVLGLLLVSLAIFTASEVHNLAPLRSVQEPWGWGPFAACMFWSLTIAFFAYAAGLEDGQ